MNLPEKQSRVLGASVIVLVTLVLYIPAMRSGFIWDDDGFVIANPLIRAEDGLYRFWFTTEPPDYFPLVSSSLWLEWRLWGENAAGYHTINILLHALSAILLWQVLRKLTIPGGWLAGLIFAVHPVNVEAVAWITQRKSTLPMVFYLLALLMYLQFENKPLRRFYFLSLGAFLLALLCKPAVVMLPLVLLGCAWWQRYRVSPTDLLRSIPFFVLSVSVGLLALWFQYNRAIGSEVVRGDGFFARLEVAGCAVWFYLYKAILPLNLTFVYPRWEIDASDPLYWLPIIALLACFVLFWLFRRSWGRPFLAGLSYYVLALLPILGFLNIYFMKYSLVADHWQYFAIPGIIALIVGLGAGITGRCGPTVRRITILCAAIVVGFLSVLTFKQEYIYQNEETLWLDTISKNPTAWMAYYNLGNALAHQGRFDEAIPYYLQTLQIRPNYSYAHNNLGIVLIEKGKNQEAINHLSKALKIEPDNIDAHYNMGNALAAQGKFDEAIAYYSAALKIKPDYAKAHNNWGIALGAQGKLDEAASHYNEALRLDPNLVQAYYNLGNVLYKQGKFDEAIEHLAKALRLKPDHATAHYSMGLALAKQERNNEAIFHFETAVKLQPDLKPEP